MVSSLLEPFYRCGRILKIIYLILKFGLDRALVNIPILRMFRWIVWFNPFYWKIERQHLSRGARLTLALEALGPIFVKLGQLLSTRRDILPEDIIDALTKLQDRVQAFDPRIARKIIESELGSPIESLFNHFQAEPLASASIAQVHAAELKTGQEVIIKVLRPHIKEQIERDIGILLFLSKCMESISRSAQRIHLTGIVKELERTLKNELDLVKEASNASQLRRQFQHSSSLYIPTIYWEYTHTKVLVMERVHGISVSQNKILLEKGFNLHEVAKTGIEVFYTQVFQNAFFHADLHPGNVFIAPHSHKKPCWILIDFGIVGTLSKTDQHYLASNFLAFIDRDYARVAELHLESGWVPQNVRVDILEAAIRGVCEPLFEQAPAQISLGQTLLRLIKIAREFKMEVMPELLLLQKTLVNIEGLAKQLDPDINMWIVARPILEKWMKEQIGWRHLWKRFKQVLPSISESLPELPQMMYRALNRAAYPSHPIEPLPKPFLSLRSFFAGLVIGLALCGILLYQFHP